MQCDDVVKDAFISASVAAAENPEAAERIMTAMTILFPLLEKYISYLSADWFVSPEGRDQLEAAVVELSELSPGEQQSILSGFDKVALGVEKQRKAQIEKFYEGLTLA